MGKFYRRLALLSILAVCGLGLQARAATIQVTATYTGDAPGETVKITSGYLPSYNGATFYTGSSNFTVQSITNNGSHTTNLDIDKVGNLLRPAFQGYCIDLHHLIWTNTSATWDVANLADVNINVNGRSITTNQITAIKNLWEDHNYGDFRGTPSANSDAAAFQIALWTLLYNYDNGGLMATPGAVFSNSDEISKAGNWASAAWSDPGTPNADIYALISTGTGANQVQSFSIALLGAGTPPTAVPLPAAAGVGLAMLGGCGILAGLRRRLTRK
jgi:hypothetical protein